MKIYEIAGTVKTCTSQSAVDGETTVELFPAWKGTNRLVTFYKCDNVTPLNDPVRFNYRSVPLIEIN
jgi:hypothetical protein